MTNCDKCDRAMTLDRLTTELVCLFCARQHSVERIWRDGIEQARRTLSDRR